MLRKGKGRAALDAALKEVSDHSGIGEDSLISMPPAPQGNTGGGLGGGHPLPLHPANKSALPIETPNKSAPPEPTKDTPNSAHAGPPPPSPLMLPGDVEKNEKISAAKLNQSMVELVERYRDDPVGFVEDIILRGQPGDWVLQDWQKEFLGAVARGERRISVRAGHGVGKSAVCSWVLLWWMLTRYPQKSICFSAETRVLTDRGVVPIVDVTLNDLLWDGVEWVRHGGLAYNGLKETITLAGVRVTPQHEFLCGKTWNPAHLLLRDRSILGRALATALESLPFPASSLGGRAGLSHGAFSYVAPVVGRSTGRTGGTFVLGGLPGACFAASGDLSRLASNTSDTAPSSPTMNFAPAFLGASTAFTAAATRSNAEVTTTTAVAGSPVGGTSKWGVVPCGNATRQSGAPLCLSTLSRLTATIDRALSWIESTTIEGMNRAICALSAADKTRTIAEQFGNLRPASESLKRKIPVYDLVNSGPRHRYTVITNDGPLIAHNCTAPTASQLFDALFAEVKRWVNALPEVLREAIEVFSDRIVLKAAPESSFMSARTSSADKPEALAGVHSEHVLLVCDEASAIPEAVFEAAAGSMSGHAAITILIGNPTRNTGLFFKTHHQLAADWYRLHVSCLDSPLVSKDFVQQIKATYGESSNAYRVRVLGEFALREDDVLIPAELVDSAMGRDVSLNTSEPLVYGLDVARFGDDRTVLLKRQGNVVLEWKSWNGADLMETTGRVVNEAKIDNPAEICVDSIGLGAGVADRLREIGLNVRDVNVSESAAMNPQATKLRDELWLGIKDYLTTRACRLPKSDELRAELVGPTYGFSSNGKIKVEGKADMKRRGMRSPDIADALALTFAGVAASVGGRALRWLPGKSLKRSIRGTV